MRLALDVQANKLAEFLSVTPEHLSRCESGVKTLSPANEKTFRAFSFVAASTPNARKMLDDFSESREVGEMSDEMKNVAVGLMRFFFSMKIEAVFDLRRRIAL